MNVCYDGITLYHSYCDSIPIDEVFCDVPRSLIAIAPAFSSGTSPPGSSHIFLGNNKLRLHRAIRGHDDQLIYMVGGPSVDSLLFLPPPQASTTGSTSEVHDLGALVGS